jgi:MFS family permease
MSAAASSARSARVLAVLFAGVLMGALDIAIVGPALPALQQEFGVGDRALSWVFTIYVLFNLVGAPLIAAGSDRYGRRPLYMLSVGVFAGGSLVVAAAPTFEVLLAGRAIQALGAGGIFPVASAVVADTFPVERRGRVLGLIGAVFGVAFLLGPLLGGLLLRAGWQWLFLINLPIAAGVLIASARLLPAGTRSAAKGPFDVAGAAALCVLLVAAALGLNGLDASRLPGSLGSPAVWPFMAVAVAAAVLFWAIERRAAAPVFPPALLGTPRLRAIGVIAVAAGLVEAGMVFLPVLAVGAFGVEAATASLMMLPLVLALIIGAPTAGRLLDRIGPRPVIQGGIAATAAGLAIFGVTPLALPAFYTAGVLVGLGLSALLGAPLRYVVLQEAGQARRGAGQGFLTLCLGAGQLLGAAAIGGIAETAGAGALGYAAALWPLAAVMLVVLPLTLALEPRRRRLADLPAADEAEEGS